MKKKKQKKLSSEELQRQKDYVLARLKGFKPFNVSWAKYHGVQVWAKNEEEAVETAMEMKVEDTYKETDDNETKEISQKEFITWNYSMANEPDNDPDLDET